MNWRTSWGRSALGLVLETATLGALSPAVEREPGSFAIGVEYMAPGLAEVYARTGVRWAKAQGNGFAWDDIEPRPPVGGRHTYDWSYPDRLILEYQRAGFRHIHVYVRAINRWASSRPIQRIGGGTWPIQRQYLADYEAFLRALVRRYNPAHPDHVPGLQYPVEYWEIEAEWGTGFWRGTRDEYLELLRLAHQVIHSENPSAKVILIGFFLAGLFEGHPDPAEIPSTLAAMPAKRRQTTEQYLADIRALLDHPELFDVVEFHSLSDWTEICGMARFLRQTMRERGYQKPIWVGDVNCTASPMMFWHQPVPPYTTAQQDGIEKTLRALRNARDPAHAEAMAWFRAEQSRGLVKKVILAMAEGLDGINVGNLEDWAPLTWVPTIASTAGFQGMVDTVGWPRRPGSPRPAWHALSLVVKKLGAFSRVEPLTLAPGVWAYRFVVERRPVWVVWYDDGRRRLPGDPEPFTEVALSWPWRTVRITETPTSLPPAKEAVQPVADGRLRLKISSTPLFLETDQ